LLLPQFLEADRPELISREKMKAPKAVTEVFRNQRPMFSKEIWKYDFNMEL
jgi:hypothetical protein